MSEFAFDVGQLTIPLFVGTLINWALLGALAVQFYLYIIAFPKDTRWLKLLVLLVVLVELLQTLSDTRDTIRLFGSGWGNYALLDEVGWSWFSVPVVGATTACAGQIFFAWRIYILSHTWFMPVVIAVITTFQLAAGIWSGVLIAQAGRFSLLQFSTFKQPVAWLAATALCDIIIVISTCYYLLKARVPGFHQTTDRMILRIIRLTVETGGICAIFAILDLAFYVRFQGNNYHLAVCIELSKVYSNSILIILNSRANIGHGGTTAVHQSSGPSHLKAASISQPMFDVRRGGPVLSSTMQMSTVTASQINDDKYGIAV
ncbi:hypothetical protein C8R46DRAFT_48396 [Mycena filopes]|nr:hypothetical protein C8R46DRAFT_48396 [Mycena filopes]